MAKKPKKKKHAKPASSKSDKAVFEESTIDASFAFSRQDRIAAGLAFFISFIVYLLTVAPSLTGEDSGELITAAYGLGIAHPPGYPIWCILGKIFTFIPIGDIAYRVNLMSAFFSSVSVCLFCLMLIVLLDNRPIAVAASLMLAFSDTFWSQAVIAEVYALNSFFVISTLLLLLYWSKTRNDKLLYLVAFLYGLSLTNHHTTAPFGAFYALYVFSVDKYILKRSRTFFICVGFFLLGLSVYLYLPIRSSSDPFMDWGNPETLQSVLDHIGRKQYSFAFAENPRSLELFGKQIKSYVNDSLLQFTPFLLIFAVLGLAVSFRRNLHAALLLAAVFGLTSLGFIVLVNFKVEREQIEVMKVFYIPSHIIAAAWIGYALVFLQEKLAPKIPSGRKALTTVALILPVIPLCANYFANNKHHYYYASDYVTNVLNTLDENAIILPTEDYTTFGLIYLQAVEGRRQDIFIGDRYGYVEKALYADMPEDVQRKFRTIPTANERRKIERWIIRNVKRPLYFTKKRGMDDLPEYEMRDAGLIYKVVKRSAPKDETDYETVYKWRNFGDTSIARDYTADLILTDYHLYRARKMLDNGEVEAALAEFDAMTAYSHDVKQCYNNIGSTLAEHRLIKRAEGYFLKVLEIDPTWLTTLRNLAKVNISLNRPSETITYLNRVLEIVPKDYEANIMLADMYKRTKQLSEAISQYQKVAKIAPSDPRPYKEVGFILVQHDPKNAIVFLNKSLQRNPNQPDVIEALRKLHTRSPADRPVDPFDHTTHPPHMPKPPNVPMPTPGDVPLLPQVGKE